MSLGKNSDDSEGVAKPRFAGIKKDSGYLDRDVAASGFTREDQANFNKENNHHIQPSITSTEEREIDVHADVWSTILLGVDPSCIFNCMLVCKPCVEVITSLEFRQRYEKRWNTNSKLVGFTKHGRGFKLLASSELGRIMNANKTIQPVDDYFISKSDTGDGLILYGCLSQNNLYISKAGESRPIRLPMPKLDFRWGATAILSQQNSYKVILAGSHSYNRVIIQTFSSSTAKWEKSEPYQLCRFDVNDYIGGPGMVNRSRGFVYWRGSRLGKWVAFYDANNGCIRRINGPDATKHEMLFMDVHYGMSPQGSLQCAISGHKIDIWDLDDDTIWNKLHSVYLNPIPKRFDFVSFVPGRSDCIFVKHGHCKSV